MNEKKEKQLMNIGSIISAILTIASVLISNYTLIYTFIILLVIFLIFRNDEIRNNFKNAPRINQVIIVILFILVLGGAIAEINGIGYDIYGLLTMFLFIYFIVLFVQWLKKEE